MKTVLHRASSRGEADHGWLKSFHTFSFAGYHHPERMHFGVLRVLNDDTVKGGMGFSTHHHSNMEIISIPLEGDLQHQDNMGNVTRIREGDIQVMSAGTGIEHSEYNANRDKEVKFLQIWIFPREKDVAPRYDQVSLRSLQKKNAFYQVLSPDPEADGVWIHQDAWFHMGDFDAGSQAEYRLKDPGNGLYVFVLEGTVKAANTNLERRDGLGIRNTASVTFEFPDTCTLLLMEIPLKI